jgi:hypothetical protein
MAEYFAGGHLRFLDGEWRDDNGDVVEITKATYAEWYYDPNGMDWGLGAWKCSNCHTKNDNLGMGNDINPYMFAGSKFCPQCGAVMKPKEKEASK